MKPMAVWIAAAALSVPTLGLGPLKVAAQDTGGTWIQLEAQPTRTAADTRVRVFAARTDGIAGFAVGPRWFAVVQGPYPDRASASAALIALRQSGLAPADAFLTSGDSFGTQIYPTALGLSADAPAPDAPPAPVEVTTPPASQPDSSAAAPTAPEAATDDPAGAADAPAPDPAPADTADADAAPASPAPATPDETLQDARVSEQALTQADREGLQTALAWAGVYDADIDGAFGRGTRSAMEAWQLANGFVPTGVLTTGQRAQLTAAYDAVLEGMNLQLVRDSAAGVEVAIPTGAVTFAAYEPPFARFGPKSDDLAAQVLLISQTGDQSRLFGLYEILQTLEIFPETGERTRTETGFTLNAANASVQSFATAKLENGEIKGFALIWPAGDSARFDRIRAQMQTTFAATPGVLDPAMAAPSDGQAVDLIAGLQIRRPQITRSGFYIDSTGRVLTEASAVESCTEITIDGSHPAQVTLTDDALGIAVLTPDDALAPQSVAAFQTQVPRLQTEVAVAGFPYGGVLVTPTLTFGRLADIRGLNGEDTVKRLAIRAREGDVGGPVFDNGGAVLGLLLPNTVQDGQMLPADVSYLLGSDSIVAALDAAGIATDTTDTLAFMPPETLTLLAAENTVLVSCW